MGTGFFVGTWRTCYQYRPVKQIMETESYKHRMVGLKERYPKIIESFNKNHIKLEERIRTSNLLKNVSWSIDATPKNMSKSLLEAIIVCKVGAPVLIPLQFIGAVGYVNYRRRVLEEID